MTDLTLPDSPAGWHRRVWELSWPVVVANATIPLVGLVDTAVMGRMPEPAFVGAVAIGATVFSAIYWLFGFLRMGTTGLAAQAAGRRDQVEIRAVALRSGVLAAGLGILIVALQAPLNALMLRIFPASAVVEGLAQTYFLIRVWGAPALMLHMVVLGMLFGLQQVRTTLLLSILLNTTNVVLDLVLVLGFGWGVAGVASATVVSEWLALAAGLLILRAHLSAGAASLTLDQLWQPAPLRRLFGISGNLLIRSFFVQLPFFVFTLVGAGLGDLVLAANAVVMQLFMTMAFVLDGPAHTAETLCGFAFGARSRRDLADAVRYSLMWSAGLAVLMALLLAVAGETFVGWLSQLPEVRAAATALLPWAVAGPLVAVWAFHLDGVFIGTTQTATMRNTMLVAAMVYLGVIWVGLEPLGNLSLWLAMMVFMAMRGLLLAVHLPRVLGSLDRGTPRG